MVPIILTNRESIPSRVEKLHLVLMLDQDYGERSSITSDPMLLPAPTETRFNLNSTSPTRTIER